MPGCQKLGEGGGGAGGVTAGWDRVSVGDHENVLELGRGGGCLML